MAKLPKTFLIEKEDRGSGFYSRPSTYYYQEGTIDELVKAYKYTLETGQSYQSEKGNKKINTEPKGIVTLIKNLNAAVANAAANGYSGKTFRVVTQKR